MSNFTGGCLCGSIKYKIEGLPSSAGTCFCRTCQYISGGAPSHSILFRKSDVHIEGESVVYWMKSDEGNEVGRHFCGKCGTPLFSESEAISGFISIKVGSLDDPSLFNPSLIIWQDSAQPWHQIPQKNTNNSIFLEKITGIFKRD